MYQQVAPDPTKGPREQCTHWHCYRWQGSGQEWERLSRIDTLDRHSPDRPPVRTNEWLGKSRRLIAAVHTRPEDARDWLVAEWEQACKRALHPVPDWVDSQERGRRALQAITTGSWPSWSQWITGGQIVIMAVVGTDQGCH